MNCPHCKENFEASLCPKCGKPVRVRSGLSVPPHDTLIEIPYAQGEVYSRYYRVALLRPEEDKPLKLCFGCEEKPMEFLTGKRSWFNPVIITPEKIGLLKEMTLAQLATQIAYETFCKFSQIPAPQVTSNIARIIEGRNSGEMENLAKRFLRIMEG